MCNKNKKKHGLWYSRSLSLSLSLSLLTLQPEDLINSDGVCVAFRGVSERLHDLNTMWMQQNRDASWRKAADSACWLIPSSEKSHRSSARLQDARGCLFGCEKENGNLLKRQTMLVGFTVWGTKGQSVIYSVAGFTSRGERRWLLENEKLSFLAFFNNNFLSARLKARDRNCTSLIVMVLSTAVPFNGYKVRERERGKVKRDELIAQ